jgi:dTDP-4-dehydrorhamnose reductase
MQKKVLVTGANGLLGQKLIEIISKNADYQLLACSKGAKRFLLEGIDYLTLDISIYADVKSVLQEFKPDFIINTAAMTQVDLCESEKEKCYTINVIGVENLARVAKEINAKMIHISTDFIFDGKFGPYLENAEPNPISYYGYSKWLAENKITEILKDYIILRTVLVYGVTYGLSRTNIVLWAKSSLESGKPIQVVNDQFRTPTLVEDLAKACILAIKQNAQGVFNISGEEFMPINQFVHQIADFWNLNKNLISEVTSEILNQPAKRPPITGFIIEKAKSELGFQPTSIHDGLKLIDEQIKFYTKIGN